MDIYKIALFGHRDFCPTKEIEEKLYSLLNNLIRSKEYLEIYIGRNGEFDVFAASVVKRFQKEVGAERNCLTLILPYTVKDIDYYEKYYDDIIIPDRVTNAYPKFAITKRNRWMVENCDLLVCFVKHNNGGAYKAMKYAEKLERKIINLFSF